MQSVLTTVLEIAALLTLLPVSMLFVEITLAVSKRPVPAVFEGERPPLAIVMPAHNEAALIADTLRSVAAQLEQQDRLIVVADNCSDETAAIARSAGAEVISRTDPIHRGKGYALDCGIRHLEADPRDIVVIIDADCQVAPGAIRRLALQCARTSRPAQALYLMRAPVGAGPRTRIAEFAYVVKNHVRPLGLRRLGMPCQLMGTGMAFPLRCIASAKLASGHIVEDLKLGIDLARAGSPPTFCPEALVTSEFPSSPGGVQGQRARWEHGHLATMVSEAPGLIVHAIGKLDIKSLALALDLAVPPLALPALQVAALWAASALWYLSSGFGTPISLASIAAVLFAAAVLMSWLVFGRHIVTLSHLGHTLLYALGKIPLYAKFFFARQVNWVRSKRDGDEDV